MTRRTHCAVPVWLVRHRSLGGSVGGGRRVALGNMELGERALLYRCRHSGASSRLGCSEYVSSLDLAGSLAQPLVWG